MALIHVGFFSQTLGMCVSCDVILPEASTKLIGMETAEHDNIKVLFNITSSSFGKGIGSCHKRCKASRHQH